MTKLELTTELLNIVDNLLEAGITACNVHEARIQLDYLFNDFEEDEALDDDSLVGFSPEELGQTFNQNQPINITTFFSDLSMEIVDNGLFWTMKKLESEDTELMSLDAILDDIVAKNKKLPKHLKDYLHTIENIHEDGYTVFLDESEVLFNEGFSQNTFTL